MAIITISRGTYSGARELAEYLCQNLGYRSVSREDIIGKLEESGEYGISTERLDSARYRRLSLRQRKDPEWTHYIACFRAALAEEVKEGNVIYLGDNGHALLRDFPNALHVKVITDLESRVDNFMKRNDYVINRKEARKLIKKLDEQKARWVKTIYNKTGAHDPSEFDLVINLSNMSVSKAYELIRSTAELPQFQTTPESVKDLENTCFAASIRAKIATELDIIDDNIEVGVQENVLSIKGTVHSIEEWDELRELLRQLPEVDDVESHLEKPVEERLASH